MKKYVTMLLLGILVSVLAIGLYRTKVSAQLQENASGLSISPVSFELNADPGDNLVNQMKLHNPTQGKMSVKMKVEDLTASGDEGQVVLMEPVDDSTYSIARWITVSPAEFELDPGEEQYVTFEVKIPADAEPGGHYGSIVASLSGATQEVTGSSVGNERGSLILLKVSGNVEEELIVDTFTAPEFSEYGPVLFDVTFENVGNVHVKPEGFVTITNLAGNEVVQIELPANNVIPGAKRQADVEWEKKNIFGRYTATLVANYGEGNKEVVTDSITFTVFPWKLALIVLAVVVVVIVVIYKMKDRLAKAMKALAGK